MSDQIIETLTEDDDPNDVRLRAAKTIAGREWEFHKGMELRGRRQTGGTWKVWPPGQYHAFISCVPRRYVTRIK